MMTNPIYSEIPSGPFGERLVQLRLFQDGVETAPSLKDAETHPPPVRGVAHTSDRIGRRFME